MTHLRGVALRGVPPGDADRFPFTVPAIRSLESLDVDARVTFLVGDAPR